MAFEKIYPAFEVDTTKCGILDSSTGKYLTLINGPDFIDEDGEVYRIIKKVKLRGFRKQHQTRLSMDWVYKGW